METLPQAPPLLPKSPHPPTWAPSAAAPGYHLPWEESCRTYGLGKPLWLVESQDGQEYTGLWTEPKFYRVKLTPP